MRVPPDVAIVARTGSSWLLTAAPGGGDLWLRAQVVDRDDTAVMLEAGDGSPLPATGTRLIAAHGAGDGVRRFNVTVLHHVPGSRDRFVVTSPSGFVHLERREGERLPLKMTAELVVGLADGEVETIRAQTIDVSSRGIGVVSPQALRAGRRLLVLLHLDGDDNPVLAGGVVAGQQSTARGGTRMGVELKLMDPRDYDRLSRHLATAR